MSPSLDPILRGRKSQPQLLVEVLQDIQQEHGWISRDAITTVSRELGVPLMEVFRVAHFYKAFSLLPRGKNVLTLCMGTACHVRGSSPLLEQALHDLPLVGKQVGLVLIKSLEAVLHPLEHAPRLLLESLLLNLLYPLIQRGLARLKCLLDRTYFSRDAGKRLGLHGGTVLRWLHPD